MTIPSRLGKYELQSVLGKGAMGLVYKAFDPQIERTVAIKTVRKDIAGTELASQFTARFKNEAKAAGRLNHPNIVGVYEYGEDDSVAYIAMEYVDGTGLGEYLNRKTRFEFSQVCGITGQLLRALEFAHGRGVVHRDIKPANLILTMEGVLKVADFGIARVDTSELTMAGTVLGTPSYMAPEQCMGKATDQRADLFSVGVVLYELLTGQKPFTGTAETIMYQICNVEPIPPSQRAQGTLPLCIDALLARSLAKAPEARFQYARDFQQALQAAAYSVGAIDTPSDATVLSPGLVDLPPLSQPWWDSDALTTVEKQLAHFVGPLAKVYVRKAAAHSSNFGELYSILATNIDDPQERRRFIAAGTHATEPGGSVAQTGGRIRTHGGVPGREPAGSSAAERGHETDPRASTASHSLEQAFIDATTTRLAVYVGPIARIVVKKAAAQARSQEDFVQIVAGYIGTQDRHAFLREMGFDRG
jgi:serine/threonine-protein kinase